MAKINLQKYKNGESAVEQEKKGNIVKEAEANVSFNLDKKMSAMWQSLLMLHYEKPTRKWLIETVEKYLNDEIKLEKEYYYGQEKSRNKQITFPLEKSKHKALMAKLKEEGQFLRYLFVQEIKKYIDENKEK